MGMDALDGIFGQGALIDFEGSFDTQFDSETGGLIELTINRDIRIRSEKLDLDCDFLKYDVGKDRIIATGRTKHPVKLRQGKTMAASCQRLEIYPNDGKSILTGNAVIHQKTADGKDAGKTTAKRITIIQQKDGGSRILIDSGGQVEIGNGKTNRGKPAEIILDDPAALTGTSDGDKAPSQEPASRIAKPTPEPLGKPTSSKMPSVAE